jgi:hypothetical protein
MPPLASSLRVVRPAWNYSSTILGGILILSWIWYALGGRKHCLGPHKYVHPLECTHHASADFLLTPEPRPERLDVEHLP